MDSVLKQMVSEIQKMSQTFSEQSRKLVDLYQSYQASQAKDTQVTQAKDTQVTQENNMTGRRITCKRNKRNKRNTRRRKRYTYI